MSLINRFGGIANIFAASADNPLLPAYRVTCIHMAPSTPFGLFVPSYEHIELLATDAGTKTREQVADDIATGRANYYTDETPFAPRAYLEVVQLGLINGRYVRTKPDCTVLNNLLNLPRF
jgi:Protein of unknown function (DUF3892)